MFEFKNDRTFPGVGFQGYCMMEFIGWTLGCSGYNVSFLLGGGGGGGGVAWRGDEDEDEEFKIQKYLLQ